MREEHAKIIGPCDEQVEVFTKQFNDAKKTFDDAKKTFNHIKKELNNVIIQRDLIKVDLETQLNEKILEYTQKKL